MEGVDITSTNTNENNGNTIDYLTAPTDADHNNIYLDTLKSGHKIMPKKYPLKTRGYMARLRKVLLQFFSITTFQGLPHIANASKKKSYCRLIYWIVLIFTATTLMLWAVVSVTSEFVEMDTTLQSRQAYTSNMTFPAVTICNQNLFRRSVISRVTNITDDLMLFLTLISGNTVLVNNFDYGKFLNESGGELFEKDLSFYFNNSGHQLEDMLLTCQYNGEIQQCNFTQQSSTSGNCYTFNSGHDGSVFYTTQAGYFFGLELILNAEEHEYFLGSTDSVGFNVYIHEQDHFPHYGGVGSFLVSTGQLTQVVLNRADYKLLTSSFGGQCSDDVTLKYFNSYSMVSCMTECITDFVVESCNCKAQFMPGPASICKLSNPCWFESIETFNGHQCNCPVACEFTVYERAMSYAKYPAGHLTNTLNSSTFLSESSGLPEFVISNTVDENGREFMYLNNNFSESYLQNNLAKLRIYFDDLRVTTFEEILDYTPFQFIADFGGHIGLFTGAGFLTLFEIIELCFIRHDDDDDDDDDNYT